ncbi:MAG: outer membrane lipoprotein carrier protein LolA [Sphingomonadaceae bacterium]
MRLAAFALLAAPVAAIPFAAAPVAAQSASSLSQVSAHLKAVDTMTADFVQTDRAGNSLSGKVYLKRPGKIRFQYQKGVPILVVGDGKSLTMIDYEVDQVERWPIGDSPLSVLLDPGKDLSRFAEVVPSKDKRILLVKARDPRRPEFGVITIAFSKSAAAPAGLMLQGWTMLDSQNNRTTVKLANQRFNVAVSNKRFRYVDPRKKGPRG